MRASGLLLSGKMSPRKNKCAINDGRVRKPLSVKKRGLKLSKTTSLLTSANKRDGVRSSARRDDKHKKKTQTVSLRDVKLAQQRKKRPKDTLAGLSLIRVLLPHRQSQKKLPELCGRLLANSLVRTTQHQSGVKHTGHEVMQKEVFQLLKTSEHTVSSRHWSYNIRNHFPQDTGFFSLMSSERVYYCLLALIILSPRWDLSRLKPHP